MSKKCVFFVHLFSVHFLENKYERGGGGAEKSTTERNKQTNKQTKNVKECM